MIQSFRYTPPQPPTLKEEEEQKKEPQPTSFWGRLNKTTKYILIGVVVAIIILFLFLYLRKDEQKTGMNTITTDKQGRLPIETVDDIIIEQTLLDGPSGIGENKFIYF